jgi:tRNA dimethylallyltransferase
MTVRLIAIVGPTAVGKTRLGVEVAHSLSSEILSADSRQVYRGLDLGTGKDLDEYAAVDPPVPHHLIDVADPEEVYTLFRYQQDCYRVLRELATRARYGTGAVPLVMVGGSGLYVEAVIRDYRIADVPENAELRARLRRHPGSELVARLRREDPELARRTDLERRERVIRALEIAAAAQNGPITRSEPLGFDLESRVYAIRIDRSELRRRIRDRLEARLAEGLVDEVRGLLAGGLSPGRLDRLGLEYREIGAYLAGRTSYRDMVDRLAIAIGRFAKRQETWFRGMERRGTRVIWIEPGDAGRILEDIASEPGLASRPGETYLHR